MPGPKGKPGHDVRPFEKVPPPTRTKVKEEIESDDGGKFSLALVEGAPSDSQQVVDSIQPRLPPLLGT